MAAPAGLARAEWLHSSREIRHSAEIDPRTGRYLPTQHVASFVGFAPVNEPAVTILVVLDSPVGAHHGGEVGGPVFKRFAEQALAYLDVAHDVPMTAPAGTETAKNGQPTPAPGPGRINSARTRIRRQRA